MNAMCMNDKLCACLCVFIPKFRVRELLSFRLSTTFQQFLKQVNACFAIVRTQMRSGKVNGQICSFFLFFLEDREREICERRGQGYVG